MSDFEKAYDRLVEDHVSGCSRASRRPKAFLIAGPPGSGKSRLATEALEVCSSTGGNPVHVDSDRLRRYVPGYEEIASADPVQAFDLSQQWVSEWSDKLRDHAIDAYLDIVCEGLFKNEERNRALLEKLLRQSYHIKIVVKVITRALSLLQTELRYERQLSGLHGREKAPRRVPAEAHDAAYNALPSFLELAATLNAKFSLRAIDNTPLSEAPGLSATQHLMEIMATPPSEEERSAAMKLLIEVQTYRSKRNASEVAEAGSALEAAIAAMSQWES